LNAVTVDFQKNSEIARYSQLDLVRSCALLLTAQISQGCQESNQQVILKQDKIDSLNAAFSHTLVYPSVCIDERFIVEIIKNEHHSLYNKQCKQVNIRLKTSFCLEYLVFKTYAMECMFLTRARITGSNFGSTSLEKTVNLKHLIK
jgi:hypothetical protein